MLAGCQETVLLRCKNTEATVVVETPSDHPPDVHFCPKNSHLSSIKYLIDNKNAYKIFCECDN